MYLECSTLPNIKRESDINTYLMLWDQEPLEFEEIPSLMPLYNQLPNADLLLLQLEYEKDYQLQKGNLKNVEMLTGYMIQLLKVVQAKYDVTVQQILQHLDLYSRESTENYQTGYQNDKSSVVVWANVTRNPRHKVIEFDGMSCTLPKPVALESVGIIMLYNSNPTTTLLFEPQKGQCKYTPIGGILFFDLVELPDPPKKVDQWTMRPILNRDGKLNRLAYPFQQKNSDEESTMDIAVWSTQVTYSIPPHCYIDTNSKIMFWDAETSQWSQDSIKDAEVDHATGKIRFRTIHFRPTALVQNIHAEFPLKNWTLEPEGVNRTVLTLSGQHNELQILIGEGEVQVLGLHESFTEEFEGWHPISILFKRLSQIGLNFIGPTTMNGVTLGAECLMKYQDAEVGCVQGIGLMSSGFSIRRSSSNSMVSTSKCIFECKPFQSGEQTEYQSIVFDVNYKVKDEKQIIAFASADAVVTDDSRFKSDGLVCGTVYHLLESMVTPENKERIEQSSTLFKQTMMDVLLLTRALNFS